MEVKEYDSSEDTLKHIKRVQELMIDVISVLAKRATLHDKSKLVSPEKELFDKYTPLLETLTYNSPEYIESLNNLKPALDHHYENNSHHPQYHKEGIDGMDLFDIVEMFVDWKAASERNKDGSIYTSIGINRTRFNISDQLENIFINTAKKMNF